MNADPNECSTLPGTARGGRHSRLGFAIAVALSGGAALPVPALAQQASATLEEVVVTARKRTENLQDVPQSIGVFTSKEIENLGIAQFEDYANRAPSVSFISIGPGTQSFFMRGVSDGSNPSAPNFSTTGYFLDDLSMSNSGGIPDMHLYDIERIEVLNGPQGTLFGAGSMSGALRVITKKPDASGFSAGIDLDGGKIQGAGDTSSIEGFINIPVVDGVSALRLSVFDVHDGGFINNLETTRHWVNGTVSTNAEWAGDDYNKRSIEGGRLAYAQNLPGDWKLTITGSYQSQFFNGAWDEDPAHYGALNVSRFGPEYGQDYQRTLDLHLEGDVGIGDLVFASGYWSLPVHRVEEYSQYTQYANEPGLTAAWLESFACATGPVLPGLPGTYSGCNVPTMYQNFHSQNERWSDELRLSSKPGGSVHWTVGAYWEKTRQTLIDFWDYPGEVTSGAAYQTLISYYGNVATPQPSEWYEYDIRNDTLQTTEFGDITFDLTDRLSVEAGVEHFKETYSTTVPYAQYFWQPVTSYYLQGSNDKNNGKVSLTYKLADRVLLYADWAQGYRPGGTNPVCQNSPGVSAIYRPDTLTNFEVGWKSVTDGGRLLWNGALYYMPWKDYQTRIYDPSVCIDEFFQNIGNARIYGGESNVEYKATDALTLSASAAYNDPELLTNKFQNSTYIVNPSERLPNVPYFNYTATVRYDMTLGSESKGYLQLDDAHKGNRWNDLRAADPYGDGRVLESAYDIANVRFGIIPSGSAWQVEAYVTNLTNKNANVFVSVANYDHRNETNQPRTFGLHLKYRIGTTK